MDVTAEIQCISIVHCIETKLNSTFQFVNLRLYLDYCYYYSLDLVLYEFYSRNFQIENNALFSVLH